MNVSNAALSPAIGVDIAMFPGDIPYPRRPILAFGRVDNLALPKIEAHLQLGAHADAPSHF